MDIALVTGADAGPGLAIARRLIGMGCRVYALATQFNRNPFPHDDFITLSCDLADPAALTKVAEDIVAREGHVSFVVHAARRAPASLLDSPVAALAERVNVGLLAPIALARVMLPWLRKEQGHFVVLCWNGDGPAPGGPVTAAIEGGLHHFAEALFDELGSDGVRATTVYARANAETTPEAALALDPQSAINPELVADAIENLLRSRPSNVISSLVIRPAATAETPRIMRSTELAGLATRDVQLPPRQNFPSEPESIPTPTPARPSDAPPPGLDDFEDEDEDEDFYPAAEAPASAQNREGPNGPPRQGSGERPPQRRPGEQSGPRGYDPDRGHGGGPRRRRGRGGRGRGRGHFDDRGPANGPPRPPGGGGQSEPYRAPDDQRPQYPDAEQEAEERSFSRDDTFRTPHSETDEDNGGDDSAHSAEHDDRREDHGPREESFRDEVAAPVGGESREDRSRETSEQRDSEDRRENSGPREPHQRSAPHPSRPPQGGGERRGDGNQRGGGGQQGGGGQRRHRGFGRRPPPGGGRGPGRE